MCVLIPPLKFLLKVQVSDERNLGTVSKRFINLLLVGLQAIVMAISLYSVQ